MHPDRAVSTIVDDDHQHIRAILDRRCQFLPVHQEIAVTRHRHDLAIGITNCRRNGSGDTIAHRACGRGQLAHWPAIAPIPMPPATEIASAIADESISGQSFAHGSYT